MNLSVHTYTVSPNLPSRLRALDTISRNMWWAWNADAIHLFTRLDPELWSETYHSPRKMLGKISQKRLEEALRDEGYLAQLDRTEEQFLNYMNERGWWGSRNGTHGDIRIAYFSAEFGIHESVPLYSGGLGCLAGDHLKSASDLGVPLIGVGLLYREGYFRQYLNHDGWQQESYPENDFFNMPLEMQVDEAGQPIQIDIHLPGRLVYAQVWKIQVGRVPLFMLDTNIARNQPEDRQITARLYGGDAEMRIKQEILLGIGGIRALDAVRLRPTICHINEGHAAFAGLERLRILMREKGLPYEKAFELVYATNVFTTHTPVAAGHDVFGPELVDKYLVYYGNELGLGRQELLSLSNDDPSRPPHALSMTALALRLSAHRNGVSRLHGDVARSMWNKMWPGVPRHDVPIDSVTNGVHLGSWLSYEMATLYERYLGPRFRSEPWNAEVWKRVNAIPDSELWRTHERRRERLVAFARNRLQRQLRRRGASVLELRTAHEVLDPEVLTIGFARRFATYKRATLLFSDLERLERLLCDKKRPVQIMFAGKAHPQDTGGKDLIKKIVATARLPQFRNRIVFIEDYDINVGRYLVQGIDVWLNTPRRPHEASGTSGMKVAANGGLHCSILDGWWDEGFEAGAGFAIGAGEEYADIEEEDKLESLMLYDILEKEVVPLFYQRGDDGLPHDWIAMMKASIGRNAPAFNTDRMVQDYCAKFYLAGADANARLWENDLARATRLADYRQKLKANWSAIHVERVVKLAQGDAPVGTEIPVRADIRLGKLSPDEVSVDVYYGPLDNDGKLPAGHTVAMSVDGGPHGEEGVHRFTGAIPCERTGLNGFAIRILPRHEDMHSPYEPFLITWA